MGVRPTPDLVRQAVFNSLGERVLDAEVLELFGGTGALSLESLSRGAKRAICVELSKRHADGIRANFESLNLPPQSFSVWVRDVFTALPILAAASEKFDLILADPPYGDKTNGSRSRSAAQKLLDQPTLPGLLKPDGLFILGHARRDEVTITPAWTELKTLKHGDSLMRVLRLSKTEVSAAAAPVEEPPVA